MSTEVQRLISAEAQQPTEIPEAKRLADTGLDQALVLNLVLKTLLYRVRPTRLQLAEALRLGVHAIEEATEILSREGLVAAVGAEGIGPQGIAFALTPKGVSRAEAVMAYGGYIGPAPVALADFVRRVRLQSVAAEPLTRAQFEAALSDLVLADETVGRIGRAVLSRRPLLLRGSSGNGKTTIARSVANVVSGAIWLPYAIEAVGQIIQVFNPSIHEPVEEPPRTSLTGVERPDRRWVRVRRPLVWTGGELTRRSLDLMYDQQTRTYEAPVQMKAVGGALIIDDLGRQQIPAVELLNRWITALDSGVDHLTLHTGQIIEVPFDALTIFSTNMPVEQLADEAFLRRIRYKIDVPNPSPTEFRRIFEAECARNGIDFHESAYRHLIERWYRPEGRELRGCHPRDLVEAIVDASAYAGTAPRLSPAAIDEACENYFLRASNAPR